MKYSLVETKKRQEQRKHKKDLRTVHRHLALFPTTCCNCGREFQFEVGYRVYYDYAIAILVSDICNDCAGSREEACKIYYESESESA